MPEIFFPSLVFPRQKSHYTGKTREMYFTKDNLVANIATNRLSAFNKVFDVEIPFKGAVLNLIAAHFLQSAKNIMPVWFKSTPNVVASVGVAGDIIPYEIIVRGYLAGSAWRLYEKGERHICGIALPEGLKQNDRLPSPIITPTRKSEDDEPVTREIIISEGIISKETYETIERYAFSLFEQGQDMAKKAGLILVDTKYEFMIRNNTVYLADEVHTPDSSRYFILDGYEEKQKNQQPQEQLSKEFFREWLMSVGFGEKEAKEGKALPVITPDIVKELSEKYIGLYEKITGKKFPYEEARKMTDKNIIFLSTRLGLNAVRFDGHGPQVGIVMGSSSDLPIMDKAAFFLEEMGICYDLTIASAHRTPERMEEYARKAKEVGIKVIIAGAGGAAHLPGMISGSSTLPVIGVPIKSSNSIDGWDSILLILQMPEGVPTLTVSLNGAKNAGIAAAQIIGTFDKGVDKKVSSFKASLAKKVYETVLEVSTMGYPSFFS